MGTVDICPTKTEWPRSRKNVIREIAVAARTDLRPSRNGLIRCVERYTNQSRRQASMIGAVLTLSCQPRMAVTWQCDNPRGPCEAHWLILSPE